MTLRLDSLALPGKDPRVTVTEQIERSDLSGETSSHKGWKASIVTYTCKVPFDDAPGNLGALRNFWWSKDTNGEPQVYQVEAALLEALGIHCARFTDFFKAIPDEKLELYHVTMTMIEARSIPERASPPSPLSPGRGGAQLGGWMQFRAGGEVPPSGVG